MLGGKQASPTGQGTIVGTNVKLIGTLQDANDIVVHGQIEGEIISNQAVNISETAFVKGPVSGEIVSVAGKVRGAITATNKLEILPTGKVFGSITSKDISIRSGAIFVGKCTMPNEEKEETETESATAQEGGKNTKKDTQYEVE